MKKKMLTGIFFVFLLSVFLCGCSVNGQKNTGAGDPKQGTNAGADGSREEQQKAIMKEFDALVAEGADLNGMIEFVNKNITLVSKADASQMVLKFEALQEKHMPSLENKYSNEDVQRKLSREHQPDFDINKIYDTTDPELKRLLAETKAAGFKVETAEGYFFPIVDYAYYKKYSPSVTADIRDYIDLMAVESDNVSVKDAALVVGWDEIMTRALSQEKFISQHKNSEKINKVKDLYKNYVIFALYGANNTPVFSYDSKTVVPDARSSYMETVAVNDGSKFRQIIGEFVALLKKNNFKLTEEVDSFRKKAVEDLR